MFKISIFLVFIITCLTACGSGGGSEIPVAEASGDEEDSVEQEEKPVLPYFFVGVDENGEELWKSDGTGEGTVLVKDIHTQGDAAPEHLLLVGEVLYFHADHEVHGTELWRSDGTEAGTYMVKDVNTQPTGVDSNTQGSVGSREMVSLDGIIYFEANDGVHGRELWRSDGSSEGTYMLKDTFPGVDSANIQNLAVAGNHVFFKVTYGADKGFWVSDGTSEGTNLLRGDLSFRSYSISFNNELFFQANDQTHGDELWRSDGTVAGTIMVKDIRASGSNSSSPINFAKMGDAIYFQANDGIHNYELWRSDGTGAGTVLVKDIKLGGASRPKELTVVGNTLYFTADDGISGTELWKSDGTEAGTTLVKDINIHPGGPGDPGGAFGLTAVNSVLYFGAHDGVHGSELWRSDGTGNGTQRVTDINIGISDSRPYLRSYVYSEGSQGEPCVLPDGRFFINATETNYGRELYLSDGQADGATTLVKDINVGSDDGFYNDEW